MKRKISLALLLVFILAALYGCGQQQQQYFPPVTQKPVDNGQILPTDTVAPAQDTPGMNPESEEDIDSNTAADAQQQSPVETSFAGSTPLPLDPIDLPSPPPRDKLTFSYQNYEAKNIGVTFDGPVGWTVDDQADDTFTITEPEKRDNYAAFISIHKRSVNKQYNTSDLEKEVKDVLDTIGSTNYTKWEPTYTAERKLMDNPGVYANYSGTLVDGTRVRGRVHVTCIDKMLFIVHFSHAANYNSDYLKNDSKLRDTIKLTK